MTAPEKSIFYLLSTTFGEQERAGSFDGTHEGGNRRIWNALMARNLDKTSKNLIARVLEVEPDEFEPLTAGELHSVCERLVAAGFNEDDIPTEDEIGFLSTISFRNIHFQKPFLMNKRLFPTLTDFSGCIFNDNFSVQGAVFEAAHFSHATFNGHAYFINSKFGVIGSISNCSEFIDCKFAKRADFSKSIITNGNFTKSRFETSAHFEETVFHSGCPKFFDSELPEDTIFTLEAGNWHPPLPESNRRGQPKEYSDSTLNRESLKYSALRKRMETIQRPSEVQFFMRKELSLKGHLKGWDALLIKSYGYFSDFGSSIGRPLLWLSVVIAFGAAAYSGYFIQLNMQSTGLSNPFFSGVGLSISSTFSFLGLNRLFFSSIIPQLPPVLVLVLGLQTISGFVLSFLLGLGLRSRLRLK